MESFNDNDNDNDIITEIIEENDNINTENFDEDILDYGNNDYNLEYDINEACVLYENNNVGFIDWNDETDQMIILWEDKILNINRKEITIEFDDINLFNPCLNRSNNDENNKKREYIIYSIINKYIPDCWYIEDNWKELKDKLFKFLDDNKPCEYESIKCVLKAGRKNNDFNITYYTSEIFITIKTEFKFNVNKISSCPQWVSPMHPSKFMTNNFEEYHYYNYLGSICNIWGVPKPNKNDFVNKIHYEKPECVEDLQFAYYKGAKGSSRCTGLQSDIEKCVKCKDISKKSISEFLNQTELNVDKLNDYLLNSQKDKHYMLFDTITQSFKHEKPDKKDYTIKSDSIKKTKNSFIGETESGKKISILLRWKNGNGIAFPAFQIK